MDVVKHMLSSLDLNISDFKLSVRSTNCLKGIEVAKIRDLVRYTDEDLLKVVNFGRKCLKEIEDVLSSMGLHLGMTEAEVKSFQTQHESAADDLVPVTIAKSRANGLFEAVPWMVPVVATFLGRIIEDEGATVGTALSARGPKGSETRI